MKLSVRERNFLEKKRRTVRGTVVLKKRRARQVKNHYLDHGKGSETLCLTIGEQKAEKVERGGKKGKVSARGRRKSVLKTNQGYPPL